MKKQIFFFLSLGILALSLPSCEEIRDCTDGDGGIVTQEIELDDFHSIELQSSSDVEIWQGDVQKVEVTGHQNIIDKLETDVINKTWDIDLEKGCYKDLEDMTVVITIPDVENVKISSSGDVSLNGDMDLDRLDLKINGSGDIAANGSLIMDDLKIKINGSGNIEIDGETETQSIEILGSGKVRTFDLQTQDSAIKVNGSGDVEVAVSEKLDIRILGSGDVFYKGSPTDFFANIDGSGNVEKVD